ncbi:hypothetical protein FDECE_13145 [Fusarium decemcellulare]|nr:hypothetical protein FDECE_13145 [Fusarium decemcellulare]
MSDVRSLLRQQRAARRIEHPHAAYSDAGKLLCTLCHEHIKTESLWDSHIRSEAHKARFLKAQGVTPITVTNGQEAQQQTSQKRKHDDTEDANGDGDIEMEDATRRKRNKPDTAEIDGDKETKDQNSTPPRLNRRTSATPSQGVELQIPSRPATPAHRDGSSASTPGGQPNNTLTSQSATVSLPSRRPSSLATDDRLGSSAPQVDEAEWAAFEADIAATTVPYDEDAVISAPAMTAQEAADADAAKEEEAEKRRAQADVDLEDEKEEATRALEEEFEEMEELEARVRRLKEKREALRKRGESFSQDATSAKSTGLGKENLQTPVLEEKEEEDDDEDEDEEDDWDGFRFRAA